MALCDGLEATAARSRSHRHLPVSDSDRVDLPQGEVGWGGSVGEKLLTRGRRRRRRKHDVGYIV